MLQFNNLFSFGLFLVPMQTYDPLVSIIIINWNGGAVLERCLASVFLQTVQSIEVILVDNASTDHSMDQMEARWPQVNIIRMEKNMGFAAANNIAAGVARGKWLALLNSDAFPEPNWLESLLAASEEYPGPFFFASCQIQANDPEKLDGTGDQYNIGGIAWRRQHNQPVDGAINVVDEVFSACGASAFYPRKAFLDAGGFDDSFFSYLEDIDLGFRLRLLGYRCLYVPQARVFHVGSASLGRESEFAIYHSLRNMVWVFYKNMPARYFWKYLPVHVFMSFAYSLYYALCCCPWISLRAMKDALLGLPSVLRTRKKIQSTLIADPEEVIRMIRMPLRKKRNPFGVILLLPKMLIAFVYAVKKCRSERQIPDQADVLKEISAL